jgi:hypothetical protein
LEGGCLGSGFFVTNDLIATNKHVLACGGRGTVSLAGNRRTFPIIATWADPQHDLALVRVAGANTLPLTLSARGWPAVGDDIYVAGNPAGLEGTFSAGIVSGLRQSEGLIQFDAPISPGSSGGPVVDARGQVVGVTVSSVTQGQNLNFAVSAQYLPPLIARARRTAPETAAPGTRRQPPAPAVAPPTPTVAPPAPTHPALRAWSAQPDWHLFVSTAIGDTVVPDKLRALLAAGLDADTTDRRSQTALHVAARRGQVELSRYLLAAGADIDVRDAEGRTPLMLAAGLGDLDLFTGTTSPVGAFLDGAAVPLGSRPGGAWPD